MQCRATEYVHAVLALLTLGHLRAGLLLHNLSVYRGCQISFDSSEVPGRPAESAQDTLQAENAQVSPGLSDHTLLPCWAAN